MELQSMAEKILLLGHSNKTGMELARFLIGLGHEPMADDWASFSPRSYGRYQRPRLVLANVDAPAARPMAEFIPWIRKLWGASFPIIAVTGSGRFRDLSALIDAGADDCLAHSAPAAMVERKIARCLREDAPAAELAEEIPESLRGLLHNNSGLLRLRDIADVHPGAVPRRPWCRRMAPPDDSWRGVAASGTLDRFFVGKPQEYLLWTRLHLFRLPNPAEYSVPEKVLLSRSGPPLVAAVDRSRLPAGNDVYSIIPKDGVSAGYIACLLNSRLLDFYFNRLAGGADGRLRAETVRNTPVPRPSPETVREFARLAALLSHFGPNPQNWIDRQSKEETWEQMEELAFNAYGAGSEAKSGLEALHF